MRWPPQAAISVLRRPGRREDCEECPGRLKAAMLVRLGIPAKLNTHSEGKLNGISGRSRTPSERSDAGFSIVREGVRIREGNLSAAQRRKAAAKRRKGCGQRGGSPCPRLSNTQTRSAQRSELDSPRFVNTITARDRAHTRRAFLRKGRASQ
jgi:hypothetical protein